MQEVVGTERKELEFQESEVGRHQHGSRGICSVRPPRCRRIPYRQVMTGDPAFFVTDLEKEPRAHASEQPIRRQQIASLHPAFWVGSGRGGQPQREPMSVFGRAHSACCSAPLCAASSVQPPQHICSLRAAYPFLRPFLLASGPGGRDHEHGAAPELCRLSSFTSPSQRGFLPGPLWQRGHHALRPQAAAATGIELHFACARYGHSPGWQVRPCDETVGALPGKA
jgi:hypothetical protein